MQSNSNLPFYKTKVLSAVFYSSLIIIFLLLVFRIALIFSYNAEIGGIDNNFVYGVIRELAGYSIYPNPTEFPYAVNPYAPLYFEVCTFFGKILNVSIDNPIQVYRLCRAVSLLCDIITCYLLYVTLLSVTGIKKPFALFITALFAIILCNLGYTFSRSDSLFLCFYSATIFILLRKRTDSYTFPLLLALLCTICIFAKQNGIILPFLVGICLLVRHHKKQAVIFTLTFILLLVLTFFFYWKILGYEYFPSHVIKAIQNRIDWSWFYVYIFKSIAGSLLLIPLSVALMIAFSFIKRNKEWQALAYIYIIQLVFSIGLCLKWGSSLGYFNESFLLAFVLIAIKITKIEDGPNERLIPVFFKYLLPILAIFFIHVYLQGFLFFIHMGKEKRQAYQQQILIKEYLQPRLGDGYVFNLKNPNLDFLKNIFYKEMAAPNFDIVDCCTLPDQTFDYSGLKSDFQNGRIKFLLEPKGITDKEIWGLPLNNYRKDTTLFGYDIYQFQSASQ